MSAPSFPPAEPVGSPDLAFSVRGADVLEYAASPTLRFDLAIDARGASVRSLSLDVIVRIDAARRAYEPDEQDRMFELFGAPRDWGRSVRALKWARASLVVPPFDGSTHAELCVPCSYDFDVAAHKYLHAVGEGVIPLEFLFRGAVFYREPGGGLQVVRLSWNGECRYEMPASAWREVMDRYFPGTAWLRLRHDVFERLVDYRRSRGLPTWEATLDALLADPADGEGLR